MKIVLIYVLNSFLTRFLIFYDYWLNMETFIRYNIIIIYWATLVYVHRNMYDIKKFSYICARSFNLN